MVSRIGRFDKWVSDFKCCWIHNFPYFHWPQHGIWQLVCFIVLGLLRKKWFSFFFSCSVKTLQWWTISGCCTKPLKALYCKQQFWVIQWLMPQRTSTTFLQPQQRDFLICNEFFKRSERPLWMGWFQLDEISVLLLAGKHSN